MTLLSIVITTKDRPNTAVPVISLILGYQEADFELVVQDCGVGPTLQNALMASTADRRLSYERTAPVSMTENWNRALSRARGDYLVVVGDDDIVVPEIFSAARWARACNLPAVSYRWATYHWSDFPDRRLAGRFRLGSSSGSIEWLDSAEELRRSASGYGADIERLPHLYHGLVKREVLVRLHRETGAYVDSMAPDYYSAFAVATAIARYPRIDVPLSIMGHSGASNSARARGGARQLIAHVAEYTGGSGLGSWLPPRATLQVIMADAMLRAFARTHRRDLAERCELSRVYASAIFETPRDIGAILKCYERMRSARSMKTRRAYTALAVAAAGKAVGLARDRVASTRPLGPEERTLPDLSAAIAAIHDTIHDRRLGDVFGEPCDARAASGEVELG